MNSKHWSNGMADEVRKVQHRGYDCTEFTIKVTMRDRWVPHFLAMLAYMQHLGGIGSSRQVALFADGDGDFRPKFEWPDGLGDPTVEPVKESDGNRWYDAG